MKKIFIIYIIIASAIYAGELKDKTDAYLLKYFGAEVSVESHKYDIPKEIKNEIEIKSKQRFYSDYVYLYKIKKNDELIAYAILDNVIGKVQPITYLVIYDLNLTISDFQIIKYREEHGGEVQNESWRKQFIGRNSESQLSLNENIDGITGATISVKSLIKGITKTSHLLKSIINNE